MITGLVNSVIEGAAKIADAFPGGFGDDIREYKLKGKKQTAEGPPGASGPTGETTTASKDRIARKLERGRARSDDSASMLAEGTPGAKGGLTVNKIDNSSNTGGNQAANSQTMVMESASPFDNNDPQFSRMNFGNRRAGIFG